ncbi:MAG TPA: hypothetical protein VEL07_10890 [Planctomycetota bacterium]|nr:hypothetical protein [Planctomycetota bacterium]
MSWSSRAACLLVLVIALAAEDAAKPLDGRAYAIDVAAGGGAPARRATLRFAGDASTLDYGSDAALAFTYVTRSEGDSALGFDGRFVASATVLRGTVVGEAIKGEIIAGDDARPFAGVLTREAANLLERARERQLQRRPKEAIELYSELIERHRGDLANSAPALVYLVECCQSLAGDPQAATRWQELSSRYLTNPPPLDGTSTITIDQAKQDLLLKSWASPVVAPPGPGAVPNGDGGEAPSVAEDAPTAGPGVKPGEDPFAAFDRLDKDFVDRAKEQAKAGAAAVAEAAAKGPSWHWWIGAIGFGSPTARLDEALIRRREDEPLDGFVWGALRRVSYPRIGGRTLVRAQMLKVAAGTDPLAVESGEALIGVLYDDQASHGTYGVYDISVDVSHSDERDWIYDIDLTLSGLHGGYHEDDFGRSYRIGARLPGAVVRDLTSDQVRAVAGIDRIIDYKTGERRLATETYVHLNWQLTEHVLVYAKGAYCRDARREDGSDHSTWTGAIGFGWDFSGTF